MTIVVMKVLFRKFQISMFSLENLEINHIRHFIKIPFINKGVYFIDYLACSEIYRHSHTYKIIFRTVKYKSFVINIIHPLGALYLIPINLSLIFISKLVPLVPETVRTLNMFIRLRDLLLRAI